MFRYFDHEEYALNWIKRGRVRFKPLAYYRELEALDVRGDAKDGTLQHQPKNGLLLTKEDGTQIRLEGWTFESSAKGDQIFIHCLSLTLSLELAKKFGPFCVEITEIKELTSRIKKRENLGSKLDYAQVYHGKVDYRPFDAAPDVNWALPERLALIKPPRFAVEDEYRIAIGTRGAFDVENVDLLLRGQDGNDRSQGQISNGFEIELGSLSEFAKLHRL